MTAARSRRAGRGRKVTQEIKRGTTRTGAAKARALSEGRSKLELKAPQTGTSRKAMRDSPKPEQEIKRGTTRTRQPRVEREVVPGTTRVRKTGDGSKKGVGGTAPGIMLRDSGVKPKPKTKPKPSSGKTSSSAASKPTTSTKPSAASKTEKKKDKEKKTLFGIEIKPSSRFAGRGGKARRVAGRAMGGMMKSKMASKGGAKGGKRMPPGMKKGGPASKFPDLSGDGKVTQKDILMGKGVIGGRGLPKKPAKPKAGGRSSDAIKKARTAKMDEMKDRLKASKMGPGKTKMEMANAKKKAGGGMMKSKMSSKGGAKGGRMPGGMQAGGMMKSKMSSKGGAKGGRMPGGMKNGGMAKKTKKGYALGGMTKKGMAKGGAMTKKGMAKGGTNKKRAVSRKPRGVGAALRGFGKALKK